MQVYFEANMQENFDTYSTIIELNFTQKMFPQWGFVGDRRELSDEIIDDKL